MPKVSKVFKWKNVLPSTYQQVEYIQSTATNPWTTSSSWQVINTWYTHNPNTKVEIEYQYLATTVQQRMFGSETTNSSYSTFVTYINWSTQWARATKDWEWNWQSTSVSADTNKHTFILDKSTYKIYTNWSQIHSSSNAYTMTKNWQYPLSLFATRNSWYSSYIEHASAKLYYCKIRDNWTLVRDFIPCYRKSDSVIGLYDLVWKTFYTNQWTWSFTKGSNVDAPVLREFQVYPSDTPTPSVVTEEYTLTSTTEKVIGKSWYKITKLILEESYSYSTSSWYIAWLRTYVSQDSSKPIIFCDNYTGWTYWYNYWYWMWSYWGICVKPASSWSESTQISIAQINSSATTSSQWAYKIVITEQSIEYHYGKTAWTWIQEWTSTLSSAVSWYINTLFTNTSIAVNEWTWGWPTFTAKVTVTYQST